MGAIGDVKAVIFDAYGTLLDWASAAEAAQDVLGDRWQPFAELWRAKQKEYAWARSLMGKHADYWQVTGESLDFTLATFHLDDAALRSRLLGLFERLRAYPDAPPALKRLRAAGKKTAVLSNGSPRMLGEAAAHSGLSPLLDAIISVEEARMYKPHPSSYQLACTRLGLWPSEVLYVSANGWDAYGAKAYGYPAAWVNRERQARERIPEQPDLELGSLAEIASAIGIAG